MSPRDGRRLLSTALGAIPSVVFSFPFLWMLLASFKSSAEIFTPIPLFPKKWTLEYFEALFAAEWLPYPRLYMNSLMIAAGQTVLALAATLTAGFVLGHYRFRGSRFLFVLAMLVILLPRPIMIVPLFTWMDQLRLLDTLWAVILPGTVSGIGLIYFTLFFRRLPQELLDAARVEGASEYRVFALSLNLIRPAISSYALIHFILAWHEHLLPMMMLFSPEKMPVTVKLASMLDPEGHVPYALLMAGACFTVLPTVLFFAIAHRQFKSALSELLA